MANFQEIEIHGCVSRSDGMIDEDDFYHEFIEWVESKGYKFGGGINGYVPDGDSFEDNLG